MARYDKYEPFGGGFRAPLAADFPTADHGKIFGVGLNASGQVVKGAGVTGILGLLILTSRKRATEIVDVMTNGEIVEAALTAGTVYFADATTGVLGATGTGKTRSGFTVEADRLVVRVAGIVAA